MGFSSLLFSTRFLNFTKSNEDYSLEASFEVYEDLSKTDERYEFVIPNYDYKNKLSISDQLGQLNFRSRGYYKNYETNKKQTKNQTKTKPNKAKQKTNKCM